MENKKFKAISYLTLNHGETVIKKGDIIEIIAKTIEYYAFIFVKPNVDFIEHSIKDIIINNKDYFINIIDERNKILNEILQ